MLTVYHIFCDSVLVFSLFSLATSRTQSFLSSMPGSRFIFRPKVDQFHLDLEMSSFQVAFLIPNFHSYGKKGRRTPLDYFLHSICSSSFPNQTWAIFYLPSSAGTLAREPDLSLSLKKL